MQEQLKSMERHLVMTTPNGEEYVSVTICKNDQTESPTTIFVKLYNEKPYEEFKIQLNGADEE